MATKKTAKKKTPKKKTTKKKVVAKKAAKKSSPKKTPSKKAVTKTVKKTAPEANTSPAETEKREAPQEKVVEKKAEPQKQHHLDGTYHYAVGRRKTAVAQVRLYPRQEVKEDELIVNDRLLAHYFPTERLQAFCLEPLRVCGMEKKFAFSLFVKGGGPSGQVGAAKLAIARALTKFDDSLRPILKAEGLLTRDARKVERKKPGLRKARRSPQWSKR